MIALVAVVAAIAIGGGILIGRSAAPSASPASASAKADGAAEQGSVAGDSGAAGQAGAQEGPADGKGAGTSGGTSGSTSGRSAAGGPSSSQGDAKGREVPVAPAGSKLTSVPAAPAMTISQIKVPDGFKTTACTAVFEPYGWAPDGERGKRIAVKVVSWSSGDAKDLKDLTGRNALIYVAESESAPTAGGRYEGSVEVRSTGDGRASLFLLRARKE